jgi:hypothetical protein
MKDPPAARIKPLDWREKFKGGWPRPLLQSLTTRKASAMWSNLVILGDEPGKSSAPQDKEEASME